MTCAGIVLTGAAYVLAPALSGIFVGYDAELLELTIHVFRLYAVSFIFCGFGVFGSGLFTALNNGLISAIISFMRTLIFQTAACFAGYRRCLVCDHRGRSAFHDYCVWIYRQV